MFDFLTDQRPPDTITITALTAATLTDWLPQQPDAVRKWADLQGFKAQTGQIVTIPDGEGGIARVLMGLGAALPAAPLSPWPFTALPVSLPAGTYAFDTVPDGAFATTAALGWALGTYRFERYRMSDGGPSKAHPHLVVPEGCDIAYATAAAKATFLVRDLVNTPANDMGPADLEREALDLAARIGAEATTTIGEDLLDENFPAIYEVGKGSVRAPRLIDLRWGDPSHPKVTLVGKGVCFDTGGYDIKPGSSMALMKKDMGGAAHVLGLAQMIAAMNLPVRLRVLIPAVENSISGNAFRPSDVIASRKGLTIEIGNTDAEGRLILADALALACEEDPALLIDFATLTGAARSALGPEVPPFFTDGEDLAAAFTEAARVSADPVWRLPLWQNYADNLKSNIADMRNDGGPFAGAVVAGLFLKKFVADPERWIHLDIYAWNPEKRYGRTVGGEAMAMRAAFEMIVKRFACEN
ncbi:leucyl aminopeptidase family protein [Iodidimonas sp. SYSU 1G8]|uniref:leucyl aminopeptidase family protein n=1 Tax=Iodidimonas sp. SYSU 1G8 TaxID=3133967 RepID=UPI0031FECD29